MPGDEGAAIVTAELRRVDAQFAERLSVLWSETFRQAYGHLHSTANIRAYCDRQFTVAEARAALEDPGVVCKIALIEGAASGFYLTRDEACPHPLDGRSAELRQIYVLRDRFGSGLGQLLFDDALLTLRSHGMQWVWLTVADLNTRARRFYRKHGFSRAGVGKEIELGTDRLPATVLLRKI